MNFGLHSDRTAFIRSPTNRSELGLHVIHLDPSAGLRALMRLVFALVRKLQANDRMLVFFECCQLAESFAKEHNFAIFHSKLPGSDIKSKNLRLWDSGATKVMACTSAFGFGVDRPNIRFVVIFNPKYSLLTTMQMAGRAGRDGMEAHVFLATSERPPSIQEKDDLSFTLELGQLMYQQVCRVYQAMYSMDGPEMARTCMELRRQVPCDVCNPGSEMHLFVAKAVQDPTQGEQTSACMPLHVGTTHGSLKQTAIQPGEVLTNGDARAPRGMSLASTCPGAKVRVCCMA